MKEYTVVNILDMLEAIGEENLSAILSDFSCPINKEIENFVWHNAIEFAKKKMSITYFPFLVPKLNKKPIRTKDLDYDYTNTYKETYIRLSSQRKEGFHCMFIGKRQDKDISKRRRD